MKETILDTKGKPRRARGRRGRNAALMAAVALCACMAVRLGAEVIDDFEDPTRSEALWTRWVWNGTGTQTVANGQVKLEITPPAEQGGFSSMGSVRTWTLREGRTLELRADLLSSNDDGALAWFGFLLVGGNRMYTLVVDEDTVALVKRESPGQAFFLTNGVPIKVSNVKLVVSMTGTNSSVLLKFKILDNDNGGAVIFQREVWDTAAADPMQRGVDDPPESYLGATGSVILSLFRDPGYVVDPEVTLPSGAKAEVVYDNVEVLEYYPPHLEIAPATNGVDLIWNLPHEEQIVVQADQLAGPWCPCPQPYTRTTNDLFCLNLPCPSPQQFFKLRPGWQFQDEFDGSRQPWRVTFLKPAESSKHTFTYTNGVLRIRGAYDVSDGRLLLEAPAFPHTNRDFHISVDVVDWEDYGTEQIIGVFARFTGANAYIAELWWNSIHFGNRTVLNIWDGARGNAVSVNPDPNKTYRLVFRGVANLLTTSLFDLSDLQTPVASLTITNNSFAVGSVGLWCSREYGPGLYDVTIDNFAATATKP